ncbi:MAG: hypothetical protein ACKVJK_11355, partial [Methylophagaceae bacterium]
YGCTDATAMNFDANADTDDGSCFYSIPGCTDSTALNYDVAATADDGSCQIPSCATAPENVTYCPGNNDQTEFLFNETVAGTPMSIYFNAGNMENNWDEMYVISGFDTLNAASQNGTNNFYSNTGQYYEATAGSDLRVVFDTDGSVGCASGSLGFDIDFDVYCGSQIFLGCTDATALNYDSIATQDNGSCVLLCDLYVVSSVVNALPSCNGAADASASASAPAMVDTLNTSNTFLWSDGQTNSTATGLAAGTYTCTITDATSGCSATTSVTIDATTVISSNATAMDATIGLTNGSMSASPNGGTPCYNGGDVILPGVAFGTYWGANAFDIVPSTDLAITSVDIPTYQGGQYNIEVYYSNSSLIGIEQDASAWTLAGSVNGILNNLAVTNVVVNIPVIAGDTVAIYISGTNSAITSQGILFGAGSNPASTSVSFSDDNMNVLGGIAGTEGAAGTAAAIDGYLTSYDFSGTINYSLASYTYSWVDLGTGNVLSTTNNVDNLGVGPVQLTVTDCNLCTSTEVIFGSESDVYGCTDDGSLDSLAGDDYTSPIPGTAASNYNSAANIDDSSCDYLGCTDTLATNYDVIATIDDSLCTYTCMYYGWDDELTITLNPNWYTDEVSWEVLDENLTVLLSSNAYSNGGAVDVQTLCASNGCYFLNIYDAAGDGMGATASLDVVDAAGNVLASINGASYLTASTAMFSIGGATCIGGCTDSTMTNYDVTANVDDGSCTDTIVGCTDPVAVNTTLYANVDDGSCFYCSDNLATINLYDSYGDGWSGYPSTSTSSITLSNNSGVSMSFDLAAGSISSELICMDDDCWTAVFDGGGQTWTSECSWDIVDVNGVVLASGGQYGTNFGSDTIEFNVGSGACTLLGCTDPTAVNYNPAANVDDGSCLSSCTAAPYAENFDAGTGTWTVNGWIIDAGGTPSGSTGPSDDVTGGGNYMYYETSSGFSPVITMTSECLDMSALADPCLAFKYHMFGDDIGTLSAVVNGDTIWTMSGDQGDQWNTGQISLLAYAGSSVTVDFVASYGGGWWGDIAIDNVSFDECAFIPTYGCLDSLALNYDANADTDDGSCVYPCVDNIVNISITDGDGYGLVGYGASYTVTDVNGIVIPTLDYNDISNFFIEEDSVCLPMGCYEFASQDPNGFSSGYSLD